jgi:hypothetical protein
MFPGKNFMPEYSSTLTLATIVARNPTGQLDLTKGPKARIRLKHLVCSIIDLLSLPESRHILSFSRLLVVAQRHRDPGKG